jgi:uncharacterized protein YbjT (DUF2867 family)
VVESGKAAKRNGVKQFHLVSSTGANKNSSMLYAKTKGEAEDALSKLEFEKFEIYRPKYRNRKLTNLKVDSER